MRAKKAGQTPKNPEKLEDIPIPFPEAYRTKLIYDNESTRSRMLVFASEAGLGLLESATTWFMDGTFSTGKYCVKCTHDLVSSIYFQLLMRTIMFNLK
ncbi:hypothetical protein DPMN_020614 [Dreissena polymorpha]|uniref:Uncharacterized protein n=1 Tax=Dreissena polymorpha TaxID=45954 RepID=A0A9D4NH44_DREPO|nr:hypothetical protein DPMN_020614 [Dreissena polymorpha]